MPEFVDNGVIHKFQSVNVLLVRFSNLKMGGAVGEKTLNAVLINELLNYILASEYASAKICS